MTDFLVTGGSGFIGARLIGRLVNDGASVRATARSDAAAATVAAAGADPVRADLGDPAALAAAAERCEVVVHAAAQTTRGGSRAVFRRANVEGTANVVEVCRKAGVRRLVHVGTEAALLAGQALVGADEQTPLRPDSPAHYPATKAEAEQLVLAANEPDLETVVLRPRLVWGAGDTTILPELVQAARKRRLAWIGGGRHLTDSTHVDNVVEGLLLAAQKGRPGEAYFVTDDDPIEFRDFVTGLLATQGVEAPTRSVPAGLARGLTAAGETAWRVLRLPGAPPLDYMGLWLSSRECTIDITKARTELGYAPVTTRAEGLAAMRGAGRKSA